MFSQKCGNTAPTEPKNAGDLNFAVTCFIDNFIFENGCRYTNLNEMIGALECCKLELYRRLAAPMRIRFWKLTGTPTSSSPKGRRNTNVFLSKLNAQYVEMATSYFNRAEQAGRSRYWNIDAAKEMGIKLNSQPTSLQVRDVEIIRFDSQEHRKGTQTTRSFPKQKAAERRLFLNVFNDLARQLAPARLSH